MECERVESIAEILEEILEEEELVVEEGVDYSYRETDWYVEARLKARYSGEAFIEPVQPVPRVWDVNSKGVISLMWNIEMNNEFTNHSSSAQQSGGYNPFT